MSLILFQKAQAAGVLRGRLSHKNLRVEATPAEPEPDDQRRKRQARRSTKKYRLNKRFKGMRVDGNAPQRVNADGVDSSAVAEAEPDLPVEVGEGAVPNQVVSRQAGDDVHPSGIGGDPDDDEEGKQEEDDPQDVLDRAAARRQEDAARQRSRRANMTNSQKTRERERGRLRQRAWRARMAANQADGENDLSRQLQPQRLFDMAENQRPDEEETPAQDNATSELEREAELAHQRVSRANRRATRSDSERDADRERYTALHAARRAERTEEEQDQDNVHRRVQRRTGRWKEELANHEDFDIENVTGENVINGRHKLPDPTIICEYCSAWRWPGESPMKCCSKGKVKLPPLQAAPAVLAECFKDPEFRKHIRAYNQVFAFTSVGASRTDTGSVQSVRADESVQGQRGVYTYRVQGAMGHYMGSLLSYNDRATGEMAAPKFAQIYIVDADMRRRAERRRGIFADLDPSILFDLEQMMERYNPFAQDFLYFGKVLRRQREADQQPVDIVFKLHANNRASPGAYNLPTTSEVAAVMIDDGNIGLL